MSEERGNRKTMASTPLPTEPLYIHIRLYVIIKFINVLPSATADTWAYEQAHMHTHTTIQ